MTRLARWYLTRRGYTVLNPSFVGMVVGGRALVHARKGFCKVDVFLMMTSEQFPIHALTGTTVVRESE